MMTAQKYIEDDYVAVAHMRELYRDICARRYSMTSIAKKIHVSQSSISSYAKDPQTTPVYVYNALAGIMKWLPYTPRPFNDINKEFKNILPPISKGMPVITGDTTAEENIRKLRTLRNSERLSLKALAEIIGIRHGETIGHIETGSRACYVPVYNRLADLFGWEKYPTKKFLREKKLRRTFGKNYKATATE